MCAQTGGGALAAVFPGEITQSECQQMVSLLAANNIGVLIEAGVPSDAQVAHKHGWAVDVTDGVIHTMADAALVYSPGGDYVLVVFLYDPVQVVFDPVNVMVAQLSQAIYNYFNVSPISRESLDRLKRAADQAALFVRQNWVLTNRRLVRYNNWYRGQTRGQVKMPMTIQPIEHYTLAQVVAGKLAGMILAGDYQPEAQLPSERELISQFEVSRATLREALTTLAKSNLIEAQARVWVGSYARSMRPTCRAFVNWPASVRISRSKPVEVTQPRNPRVRNACRSHRKNRCIFPICKTDRLGTFEFISWWEREKVQDAKVMIVGAGALGNEVIKNLALMGIGHLFIVDFDYIEAANLSRSVLFREGGQPAQQGRDRSRAGQTAQSRCKGSISERGCDLRAGIGDHPPHGCGHRLPG